MVYVEKGSSRTVVAPANIAQFLKALQQQGANGHYHSLYVHKNVSSLKSTFANSFINTVHHNNQVLPLEGGRVLYQVHEGVVYLMDIEILPRKDQRGHKAGFYHAKYDENTDQWSLDQTDRILTKFAAVNGVSDNAKDAATVMQALIPEGYKDVHYLQMEGFTLYYNPTDSVTQALKGLPGKWRSITGIAKKSADAMNIASGMAEASAAGRGVKWTVHEDGTGPFVGALRVLDEKRINLNSKQSVFYINATSNLAMADIYGRRVGIGTGDRGSHLSKPLSIRQGIVGGNLLGSVWMRFSRTSGNWADKIGSGIGETGLSLVGIGMYSSISISAALTASGNLTLVGSLATPITTAESLLGYTLLAAGYVGWGTAILGVLANAGYQRYDQNTKQNPFSSVLGKQLT